MEDLNKYCPENDGNYPGERMQDNSIRIPCADISIIFRNQKQILLQKISEYNCVVGCVAWLTDLDILNALSKVDRVVIVLSVSKHWTN